MLGQPRGRQPLPRLYALRARGEAGDGDVVERGGHHVELALDQPDHLVDRVRRIDILDRQALFLEETLPAGKTGKKYSLKFFDDKDNFIFEIKEIKLHNFKIDKSNFYHAGWFKFELYEDGKLFEKHKFFIPKEF